MSKYTFDDYARVYTEIRSVLAEKRKEFKEYEKLQNEKLSKLRGHLLKKLDEAGGESIKTASGTIYKYTETFVGIDDADTFYDFVHEHKDFALLHKRVSKEHALEVIATLRANDGAFSPADIGLKVTNSYDIGVRKA